jgi:WD40 repeat protein
VHYRVSGLSEAAFSPNGQFIAAVGDSGGREWDTASGRTVAVLGSGSAQAGGMRTSTLSGGNLVAISPDNKLVATGGYDKFARIWDAKTGQRVAVLHGHRDHVNTVAFSPDGQQLVTASDDGTARLWDTKTWKTIATLAGHRSWVMMAAFSPDGHRVVTASADGTTRIWDAATGRTTAVLNGHLDMVESASFSADGKFVATVSDDGTARVWDASTGRSIELFPGRADAAAIESSSRLVAAAGHGTVALYACHVCTTADGLLALASDLRHSRR